MVAEITGRVALVTGAAGGIGRATSARLAADGWRVAVADIDSAGADRVAAGLGAGHRAYAADVRDEAAVARLFASVETEMGTIAALVCHAGGTYYTPDYHPDIADTSLDEWLKTEALNSRSAFLCVREYFRARARAPVADGRIVLTASQAAHQGGGPTGVAYGAFKAAVIGLMKKAAAEGGRFGTTCNAIAPGAVDTLALSTTNPAAIIEAMGRRVPAGRIAQPAEIAAAVAFLVSPGASYVNGTTIDINGGGLMR
jgi:NAD(P)-dependent dehydrogenase (short-subunit alcohol dehydrogenase family)